jgi:hypothetical protein
MRHPRVTLNAACGLAPSSALGIGVAVTVRPPCWVSQGIGIALDVLGNRMFVTDFAGSVYSADLDGKNERNFLYAQGNLTGIAYAKV